MNAPSPSSHSPTKWNERSTADRASSRQATTFGEDKATRDLRETKRVASLRLGVKEREELEYLWHNYESDLGRRSIHGSVTAHLMRGPPLGIEEFVILELERTDATSARFEILRTPTRAELVRILVLEQTAQYPGGPPATKYEVTCAVDAMIGRGRIVVNEDRTLRLVADPSKPSRTREERWAAKDAELEAFCTQLACKDDEVTIHVDREPMLPDGVARALAALAAIRPMQALALRKFYGERDPAARYDVREWGELAPLAEMTERVRYERARRIEDQAIERLESAVDDAEKTQRDWELELGRKGREVDRARREVGRWRTAPTRDALAKAEREYEAQQRSKPGHFQWVDVECGIRRGLAREVTATSVLRELLDTPKNPARKAFVKDVEHQAEQILIEACCAYRAERKRKLPR